jgi:HEAT repeat protein
MRQRQATRAGIAVYAAISLLVVAGSAVVAARQSKRGSPHRAALTRPRGEPQPVAASAFEPGSTNEGAGPPPRGASAADMATRVVDEVAALLARDPEVPAEDLAELQAELVALGEVAAEALIRRIDGLPRGTPTLQRERLLDLLRLLPGRAAEDRLIREARSGSSDSSRALAIVALGDRRSPRAIDALARIVETDAALPEHALITAPREPGDTSTELPDEVIFTPRMQALSALAATREVRAGEVLSGVLHDGPHESLRMEAARHLETFRESASALDALRTAATADPSPYVRLAALHALAGSTDPGLAPVLEAIALRDADAGVRALARQMHASVAR